MPADDPVVKSLFHHGDEKDEVRRGQRNRPDFTQLSPLLCLSLTQQCEPPYLPVNLPSTIRVIQHDCLMSCSITFSV